MSTALAEVTFTDYDAELLLTPAAPGRACCCPARPAVVAFIPPGSGRPGLTDLWLCGHHYQACREALKAARADVHDTRPHTGGLS